LNPLIAAFRGSPDLGDFTLPVGASQLLLGDLLNALLAVFLVALVVCFLVVMPMTKLRDRCKPKPQPAPTKECPECLSRVPERARRCPHCTSPLADEQAAPPAPPSRRAAPSSTRPAHTIRSSWAVWNWAAGNPVGPVPGDAGAPA
jgi:large conductance mechanosensitive channel